MNISNLKLTVRLIVIFTIVSLLLLFTWLPSLASTSNTPIIKTIEVESKVGGVFTNTVDENEDWQSEEDDIAINDVSITKAPLASQAEVETLALVHQGVSKGIDRSHLA